MNNSHQINMRRNLRRSTASWAILLILVFAVLSVFAPKVWAGDANQKTQDESVRELLEDLYLEYEAVEERLRELKEGIEELPTGEQSLLTPFTIAIKKKKKNDFNLNFLEIKDNGSPLWSHIYTPVENSAMEGGGRHQFFKGNLTKGRHRLTIKYQYSYTSKNKTYKEDLKWSTVVKDQPVFIEILFTEEDSDVIAKPKELHIIDEGAYEEIE